MEQEKKLRIGVLALQGAFTEHINILNRITSEVSLAFPVKTLKDLEDLEIDGLIIPGGESTAIALVAERTGIWDALYKWVHESGKAVWGTCAGLILLSKSANQTKTNGQSLINILPITVKRNGYGAQIDSFMSPINMSVIGTKPFPGIFIRAPMIESIDSDEIAVLGSVKHETQEETPVAIQYGRILATSFHPELTNDSRIHLYFCNLVRTTLKRL
ncbi:hypothetical protein HK096_008528 [Nowakowskiella sp. JEL0078]|nr:hypothetical protein HK096_008528 [Nowakowskiella sp. JEL0078]